ncbi:NADH dehydrogenase [Ammoniphilus oxalaticus]|uniref:NADH dehydrogenase n=1 Tax=Ammoniphilus oxalaticus TaxID=66863 RepID=A0A419SEF1_9BACL|nr:NAD(P)/FAD-dependent oxidoreductase [Ammoniphilus oxalaticus]RKD21715.1 NADH dehydrogenase [Ammoniphilus oxalaticus]
MGTKIVILGAGYGGVMTSVKLQKILNYNEAEVTVVNQHDYHYLTTWLHLPAAGTIHHDNCRIDIESIIDTNQFNFVKGTVESIQPDNKQVSLADGRVLDYDYLVVGLGSEPETFGISGLKEHAFTISNINSVRLIKEHIDYMFAKFTQEPDRADYLTFIVGGAGFTGMEFVGELCDRIPALCKEFDVDPAHVQIYNVEAAPTALPGFDPDLIDYAVELLSSKGVTFKINTPIKECTPDGVVLADGEEIKAKTVVWTGGVRGNSVIEKSGFEVIRGRVKVDEYLRAPGYDDVFVIGDGSLVIDETQNRPFPPTAQIAMQQGEALAENLAKSIRGGQITKFQPDLKGTVASLGKGEGIGIVGNKKVFGSTAAMLKEVIDHRYLYKIGGIGLVMKKSKF